MKKSTWSTQPATGEWNTKINWNTKAVPTDTATFKTSSQTEITFSKSSAATVNNIKFAAGAPPYIFTIVNCANKPALTIAGKGISNNSTSIQSLRVASIGKNYKNPQLKFKNSATAGGYNMHYYAGPESLEHGYGGGIIGFCDNSNAGSASFTVRTGAIAPYPAPKSDPNRKSTVGAEVSFSDKSSAGTSRFTIFGTLGTDGDTFGNTVFHDTSTVDNATFTNIGGTVPGGDGGNTQLYDKSKAANGVFYNLGGTHRGVKAKGGKKAIGGANGGDVAFDGTANGCNAYFHNYPATVGDINGVNNKVIVAGANGGVTSFNNNPPNMKTNKEASATSAGNGFYFNYGARESGQGGGGHTEFTAKHGSPTAGNACIYNYGSKIKKHSSAGHTIFSISDTKGVTKNYYPTAGHGTFWNYPAVVKGAAAGYTEFSTYVKKSRSSNVPTAGDGTFINLGGCNSGVVGGYTQFSGTSNAGNALLIANGGTDGGKGGQISFYDNSSGGTATVQLFGNGELNISDHNNGLKIGALELTGGTISIQLDTKATGLTLSKDLNLKSTQVKFKFWMKSNKKGGHFKLNKAYTILTAPNISKFAKTQFSSNSLEGVKPTFTIDGNDLKVTFKQQR